MFLLLSLVVIYVFDDAPGQATASGNRWLRAGLVLLGSAATVGIFYLLFPYRVTDVALGLAVLAFAAGAYLGREELRRYGGTAMLLTALASLWARGLDGGIVFKVLSDKVAAFLGLSNKGATFLFSNLVNPEYFFPGPEAGWPGFGLQFAFSVLPTIIFFSAFMAVLYHLGIVQVVTGAMARFMRWSMGTSGSETVSCSANVFVGQTEAPFLVKPFIEDMTLSELHAIMVGGFATIAGGVLAGFIQMGVDPGHLIAASVMSAPAALVIAKLLLPETETSKTVGDVVIPRQKTADNLVGAAANGVTDGLSLALNVAAMLVAFIALIAFVDVIFGFFDHLIDGRLLGGVLDEVKGEYAGFFPGSLGTLFGTILAPLAFLMGVPWQDAATVGNLLGTKLTVNEFVAFSFLGDLINNGELTERAQIISTYALCGFANFSSIGIQIGGLGVVAPGRRSDLAKIGVRAMFGGALASWMTATIAGILL
jgi:CNT family concentrative nucleoside transporter